jgi:hypothetical protein
MLDLSDRPEGAGYIPTHRGFSGGVGTALGNLTMAVSTEDSRSPEKPIAFDHDCHHESDR